METYSTIVQSVATDIVGVDHSQQVPSIPFNGCPKYERCSSPICPLDPDWRRRNMLNDESVCFYLSESVKNGARNVFEGAGLGELYEVVVLASPFISATYPRIYRALERAKQTGSRMARRFPLKTKAVNK